ncbi:hypothetical protein IBTHAUMO2_120002 [Nitrosopumilaceae archaeon]|nr:hypothetical protein IBTHAUMO2_120002 [Nitrosopumilaceae archaeon]
MKPIREMTAKELCDAVRTGKIKSTTYRSFSEYVRDMET